MNTDTTNKNTQTPEAKAKRAATIATKRSEERRVGKECRL